MAINVKEFPAIREEMRHATQKGGNLGAHAAKYGPDTGVWYDEDTDEVKVASGWRIDENGDVVRK